MEIIGNLIASLNMGHLWLIAYGLVAGVLAKFLWPGGDKGGVISTAFLGILGSIVGGWVFQFIGFPVSKGFSLMGLVPAVSGTLLILFLLKGFIPLIKKLKN